MTDAMVATTINVNAVDFEVDGIGATLNLNIAPDAPLGGLTVVGGATTAGNIGGVDMPEGEIDVNATNGAVATINLDDINIADSNSLGINLTNDGSVDSGFVIEDFSEPRRGDPKAKPGDFRHRGMFTAPYVRIKARRKTLVEQESSAPSIWIPES